MQSPLVRNAIVTVPVAALVAALLWPAPSAAQEPAGGIGRIVVSSPFGVVAAEHETASMIGAAALESGGTAADAGVAALLSLGVLNPFASGLGGGGFCLYRPVNGAAEVLDFRERAPKAASPQMFVKDGKADLSAMIRGGLAVGVPAEAFGLHELHRRHGVLGWTRVVQPAQDLAAKGAPVGKYLAARVSALGSELAGTALGKLFERQGRWVREGETLKQPGLARTLGLLKEKGADAFRTGPLPIAIAAAVGAAGGVLTADDLREYEVTVREPLRGTYRGLEILAMPPPSSGGTTLLAALNILERYDLRTLGQSTESSYRIAEALKHAFADRARWLGDADFVEVPVKRLISKDYARARDIDPGHTLAIDAYGTAAPPPDDGGTTHVSVIDAAGNMLACTSTINTSFGSMVYVAEWGVVLNNEMGDFTAQPGVPNNYGLVGTQQNAVAPWKRPLSSMSPTLVLRDGVPFISIGGSGGPTIISGTLLALIRTIDWKLDPGASISLPRVHHQWLPNLLYVEAIDDAPRRKLERRGLEVKVAEAYNGIQMVVRMKDGTVAGVSDPRKHGRAAAAKK